jgi:hypothetical protein
VPRQELLHVRAAFLSECGWGSRRAILSSLERRDRQFTDAPLNGLQVVLWFEHDLYDQLQLIDALAFADELGVSPELIVVNSFPGKASFRGLGELTATELETLWPTRREAQPETLTAARGAWEVVRAPEPVALAQWATGNSKKSDLFVDAANRLLEELPAPTDGLSGTERRALEAIASSAGTPATAFVAAQELERAPFLGDAWFYRALAAIGSGPVRLVEIHSGRPLPAPPPLSDGQVFARLPLRLTEEGESVLRGDSDRVELLGIDRWVGGTHVTTENAWRWDPVGRRLSL